MSAQEGNAASPGILNFVGGMLVGLVVGSVGAIFAFKVSVGLQTRHKVRLAVMACFICLTSK